MEEFQRIASSYEDNQLVSSFETGAVVESFNGNIKGFGVTRAILEAILYTQGSKKDKTIALKELLNQAKIDAKKMGFNQLYVFVDSDFADILSKHFGFTEAKGKCLIFNMDK